MTDRRCICPPEEESAPSLCVRRNDCPTHGMLASYRLGIAVLDTLDLDKEPDRKEAEELSDQLDRIWYGMSEAERALLEAEDAAREAALPEEP